MSNNQQWSEIPERHGLWGMKIMLVCYTLLGRKAFELLLYPVIAIFYLTAKNAREASHLFLNKVQNLRAQKKIPPEKLSTYKHFYRFGLTLLDKIASWRGSFKLGENVFFAEDSEKTLKAIDKGAIMMISHVGDIELCRALVTQGKMRKVTALVFHENAARFAAIMKEFAPNSNLNLIALKDFGPELTFKLQDLIDKGHIIAIAADRLAVKGPQSANQRVIKLNFLGQKAPFAQGPWILASLFNCPIISMFALREQKQIKIYAYKLCDKLELPRAKRTEALEEIMQSYVQLLEKHVLKNPYEWFNFFDFWHSCPKDKAS